MRFATFELDGDIQAGIFHDGGYFSFRDLYERNPPATLLEFINQHGCDNIPDFSATIEKKRLKSIPAEFVKLCAPIPMPFRNIICIGKNYADHAEEIAKNIPDSGDVIPLKPVYFSKNANPAVGDKAIIPLHKHFTSQVDYEAELAVIIGKSAWCIEPKDVEEVIFGYTVLNDVTARDIQADYGQWYLGKSLDCFCPMGPHIVSKNELPMPFSLDVICKVNGEVRQSSNTSLLIYDIPRVISELSQGIRLLPGDIISTGTPGGVGHGKNPPVYLEDGDVVECAIEKIGTLTNLFKS